MTAAAPAVDATRAVASPDAHALEEVEGAFEPPRSVLPAAPAVALILGTGPRALATRGVIERRSA